MHLEKILGRDELRGTSWSVRIRRAGSGAVLAERDPGRRLRTASVGKLLLLVEVATRIDEGRVPPTALLSRRSVPRVADSGLWQHLTADELTVADAATLVGSVSDNLATNVLLHEVGLEAVAAQATRLGLRESALHDLVRDARTGDQPPTLSEGTAEEWCDLVLGLYSGDAAPEPVCARVLDWLSACTDHSMVAAALDLDPLSHGADPRSQPRLWSKTGTDDGIRADVGVIAGADDALAYAVICNWQPDGPVDVGDVLRAIREIGAGCAGLLRR